MASRNKKIDQQASDLAYMSRVRDALTTLNPSMQSIYMQQMDELESIRKKGKNPLNRKSLSKEDKKQITSIMKKNTIFMQSGFKE